MFEEKRRAVEKQQMENKQNQEKYWWIKLEQEKQAKVKEMIKQSYEGRKKIYLDILSGLDVSEEYYTQMRYEKRLVEQFTEIKKEVCDNNADDNNNGQIDCSDSQCSGKICGRQKISVNEGNETKEIEKELFCIAGTCSPREELFGKKAVCGNHVCENGEGIICSEDCAKCKEYGPIKCNGKIIFKGKDKIGCPLDPICLEKEDSCKVSEDCSQPLCGKAECVEEKCRVSKLEECRQAECNDNNEKILDCSSGEKIVGEKCIEGMWKKTGVECSSGSGEVSVEKEIIVDSKCIVKEDCGNSDDVCSNGRCVTIPKMEEIVLEEKGTQDNIEEQFKEELQQKIEEKVQEVVQSEEINKKEQKSESAFETREEPKTGGGGIVGQIIKSVTGFVVSISGMEGSEAPQAPAVEAPAPSVPASQPEQQLTQPQQIEPQNPLSEQQPMPSQQPESNMGQRQMPNPSEGQQPPQPKEDDKRKMDDEI